MGVGGSVVWLLARFVERNVMASRDFEVILTYTEFEVPGEQHSFKLLLYLNRDVED